jgi:hypothetical protein
MLATNRTRRASQMALIAGFLFAGETAMSYEQPDYTVLYTNGEVEYRQYEPYLVSETVIANVASYNDAGSEGFRRLFRYITGANKSQAKISMTAPVAQAPSQKISMTVPVQQAESSDGWRVAFMLPTEYTLKTAPVPTDKRVYVRQVPGRVIAVLKFYGRWTERNYANNQDALLKTIDAEDITAMGEVQRAAYNAPYTLPFMRRNEVMVAVNRMPEKADEASELRLAAY